MTVTLTTDHESTRRILLAGTAIALTVRTAQADFMLHPNDTLVAVSHAAAEIVAERVGKGALMAEALAYEDGFINSFRQAYRARIGAFGIGRME